MRYSLGFILALSLAGLQFIAIITVVSASYVSSERAMLEHARGLMAGASSTAMEQTKRFLEPAREAAELSRRMIESDIVSGTDPVALESFLFQHLQSEPQLSGVYYGDEAGNFVYVMRSDGPGPYRTKFILVEGANRTIELIWRTEQFAIVEQTLDPSDTFDPRGRQWYIDASLARTEVWTDPYIFFSSQLPGITVASPVAGADGTLRGVVGVDVQIADISTFLSEMTVSDQGGAIILDRNGQVIAHPDFRQISVQNGDGTVGFVDIQDINDPVTRAAFADFDVSGEIASDATQSQFEYLGDQFMSLILPISGIDLPWTVAVYAPENDFIEGIKDNRRRNIWVAAFISLVTAIAGLTLAELILRPVRAFAVRTALVSQGEVPADDPLPRTYQELRKANQTLIHEIAQRRNSDEKIQELNRDLSHFSRIDLMGQMATGLAHELSQPLTAITQNVDTAISIAKQDTDASPELLDILSELDEQAHQGGDIIRALRGFVRKDGGEVSDFDFPELVAQTCRLMRHEADSHHVSIKTDIEPLPPVVGDRVQIAQVLINLMRNSIAAIVAAAHPSGKISITARNAAGEIVVWIEDTGPGIDADVTLFKQFQTSKPDGLGLGLTISRTIIDTNGGRLWHDPTSLEKTRFCFTVPTQAEYSAED